MDFSDWSDEAFACYLAGFTDGEGYIGVELSPRTNGVVRIVLANTHEAIIRRIQDRLGFGSVREQRQKSTWKPKFTLDIHNAIDAERFLLLVRPFLIVKADAADRALHNIKEYRERIEAFESRRTAIIEAAKTGEMRKSIAQRFGVSCQTVSRYCEGHRWPSERSQIARSRHRNTRGEFIRQFRPPQ